jgi:2-methylfumaryl-CoA hydratase
VHCNQHMIDLNPSRYLGGQLVVYGGIPFSLCLGISGPDIGDNSFGDSIYTTGRHTAPLAGGETVFASTEILAKRDHPTREDLGMVESRLYGHKFDAEEGATHDDAPEGYKKTKIFELDRQVVVKRRSHYAA